MDLFHCLLFCAGEHTFVSISTNFSEWKINARTGSSAKWFKFTSGISAWINGMCLVGITCRAPLYVCPFSYYIGTFTCLTCALHVHSGGMLAFRGWLVAKCHYLILLVQIFHTVWLSDLYYYRFIILAASISLFYCF